MFFTSQIHKQGFEIKHPYGIYTNYVSTWRFRFDTLSLLGSFIFDWILYERKKAYKWHYALLWLIYPLGYLLFTQAFGALSGDYLYPFLNLPELGPGGLATWVAILSMVFVVLSGFYIALNQVWGAAADL